MVPGDEIVAVLQGGPLDGATIKTTYRGMGEFMAVILGNDKYAKYWPTDRTGVATSPDSELSCRCYRFEAVLHGSEMELVKENGNDS